MRGDSRTWLPIGAVAVSVVLWSTAYVLSAIVLTTASPAVLSELRLVLAVPVMVLLIALMRGSVAGFRMLIGSLRRPSTVLLALTGVALFYLPSNIGLSLTSPGTAALMSATLPVLTCLFAWWILRESVTGRVALGLILVTAGIVIVCADAPEVGPGAFLLAAGLAGYATYTVLLRRIGSRTDRPSPPSNGSPPSNAQNVPPPDALVLATATALWGAILLLPWLGWEIATGTAALPSDAPGWFSILFLALVVTAPTMALYNYGAERVPAAVSGAAAAGVPVLAFAFALVLGEPLEPIKAVGCVLTLIGVVIAAIPPRLRSEQTAASGASHTPTRKESDVSDHAHSHP